MLALQFIPYREIASLDSEERVSKLLSLVKEEKIILLEGRLNEEEEAELIKKTMESINEKFKGIELGVINPEEKENSIYQRLRKMLIKLLLGKRLGFTIIGPASIVKEIKKHPDKVLLLTKETKEKRHRKK